MSDERRHIPSRYRVLRSVGAGGMGHVFEVTDSASDANRRLALKTFVLRPGRAGGLDDETRLEHFRREFATLAHLRHPSLPAVRDFGTTRDRQGQRGWYFTYDFVEGENLFSWSASRRPEEILDVTRQLVGAITLLHSRGLLHLDIKPSNVIVATTSSGPRATLVDFGLARSEAARTAAAAGSVPYMAPEVLRGEAPGPASDWFALGVSIFESLFRRRPFDGESVTEIRKQHASRLPAPPAHANGRRNEEIERLLWRLLSRDRKRRTPVLDVDERATSETLRSYLLSGRPVRLEAALARLFGDYNGETDAAVLVSIVGEAGAGKTRLVQEFKDIVQISGGRFVVVSPPAEVAFRSTTPGEALARVLRSCVDDRAARDFAARVRRGPSRSDPLWDSEYAGVRTRQERTRYIGALVPLLDAAAGDASLVVAFDDLERWGDAGVELVDSLARYFARSREDATDEQGTSPRILICATSRSDAFNGLSTTLETGSRRRVERLEPLTRKQVRDYLERVFPGRRVSLEIADQLANSSGGNPLLLIETLETLLEAGALVFRAGGAPEIREPLERWPLPASAIGVIEQRWRSLDDEARTLAARLAVVPERVSLSTAYAVSRLPRGRTRAAFETLVDRAVLAVEGHGGVYRFRHPHLVEIASKALKAEERRDVIRAVTKGARRRRADPGELALLLLEIGDLEGAADGALELSRSPAPASRRERVCARVLAGLPDSNPRYAEIAEALGAARSLLGDHAGAAELFERALRLAPPSGAIERQGTLLNAIAGERALLGEHGVAEERYREAESLIGEPRANAREWFRARLGLCRVRLEQSDPGRAEEIARDCLDRLARLASVDSAADRDVLECVARSRLGGILASRGRFEKALQCYAPALALMKRQPDSLEKGALFCNVANVHSAIGEYAPAIRLYERGLRVARRVGARDLEALASANLGLQFLYRWNLSRAESSIDRARREAEGIGAARYTCFAKLCLGTLLVRWGKLEQAELLLRAQCDACLRAGDHHLTVNVGHQLALALVGRGRLIEALSVTRTSRRCALRTGRLKALSENRLVLAITLFRLGEPARARRNLEVAVGSLEEETHPHLEAELYLWLGRCRLEVGEIEVGAELIGRGLETFRKLGIMARVAECEAQLARSLSEKAASDRSRARGAPASSDAEASSRRGSKGALRTIDRAFRILSRLPRDERPLLVWAEVLVEAARIQERQPRLEHRRVYDLISELSEARELLGRHGAELLEWEAATELAALYQALGENDRARAIVEGARERLVEIRAKLPPARADRFASSRAALRLDRVSNSLTERADDASESGRLRERISRLEASHDALLRENAKLRSANEGLRDSVATRRIEAPASGRRDPGSPKCPHGIVGASVEMERLRALIERAAANDLPVLVRGETGTGKSLVIRAVHRLGERSDRPLVTISADSLPDGLHESELFGHVTGAFTGAVSDRSGLLSEADGGTLCLESIEELPLELQVKLLRVIETGVVRPVGSDDSHVVDFRIVATTRLDLVRVASEGRFREDLLYRLRGVEISVPPLRRRRDDIPLLVDHFLRLESERSGRRPRVDADAVDKLTRYDWPGNVRELENEVRRVVILGAGRVRAVDVLSHVDRAPEDSSGGPANARRHEILRSDALGKVPWSEARDAVDRAYFEEALARAGGNLRAVARELGVHERTVYKIRKRLGLDPGNGGPHE